MSSTFRTSSSPRCATRRPCRLPCCRTATPCASSRARSGYTRTILPPALRRATPTREREERQRPQGGEEDDDRRDRVRTRPAAGRLAGIEVVADVQRSAAEVGDGLQGRGAVPLAGLDVRVLAEFVPGDEPDRVRVGALSRVHLATQGAVAVAGDDGPATDEA